VFFVFNGTAANSLAGRDLSQYRVIVCHDGAHQRRQCGAPEFMSGGAKR
jgi:threonine aldolase